jgi:putative ABC transport system ATP-binding protein
MSTDSIITVDNIHKSYIMGREAVEALRGVTLSVRRSEIVCLMGPSGSGKTTLLNILGGLDNPSRGHVIVDGEDVVALNEEALAQMRLCKMGFVFQAYNLLGNFTAEENVEAPMVLAGVKNGTRKKRAKELLALVGLADRMHHYPSELSGGQQQRVAIARAMANDPPILIGDEMTGDLDSTTGFEIMSLIEKLNHERGTTVVYVTHDPRMSKYASRTIQLRDGKISAENGNGNGNGHSIVMPIALPAELVIDDDGKLIVDRK